jgi:hypothetical protein
LALEPVRPHTMGVLSIAIFTRVRGRVVPETSPVRGSPKFALFWFSEVHR